MIGKIYQAPDISPVYPIKKAEKANDKPPFAELAMAVQNSTTDFRNQAHNISRYYAKLAGTALHELATIRNT